MDDQLCLKASTYTVQRKVNRRRQPSMLRVGLEPTIQVFERAKKFHAVDSVATVSGTKRRGLLSEKVLLLHDNACPHMAGQMVETIWVLRCWNNLPTA
jgi:hypothetical protein